MFDIFATLAVGAAIVVPRHTAKAEPDHWLDLAQRHQVSVWNSVPALMQMLVDHVRGRNCLWPSSLRLVMLSGDWIPVFLREAIVEHNPSVDVIGLGGATEASIWSVYHPIERTYETSVPYGRPLANQTLQVLDQRLEPRPEWVLGALYIGGNGLARGYWKDDRKTAAAFVIHPRTGERLYRTGDLGRYLPGGTVEFVGRADTQLKVQGYRIEAGEVEHHLLNHPQINTAVVSAVGERSSDKQLVAHVVWADQATTFDPATLQARLREVLPEYMIPSAIVCCEHIPLTPNGKIDRKALPSPERAPTPTGHVAPRDPLEARLARIWSEVLGHSPIGIHDGFFDLGGNSLLAIRLTNLIQRDLGRSLPLAHLFDHPTVERLARTLRDSGEDRWRPVVERKAYSS